MFAEISYIIGTLHHTELTCWLCFSQETLGWLCCEAHDFLTQWRVKLVLWFLTWLRLAFPLLFKREVKRLWLGEASSWCRFL